MLIPLGEPDGRTVWTVRWEDRVLAVFVVNGEYHVTDAVCPHNKGPLDQGWIRDGKTLVCPWHWFRFDLRTGECANLPRYQLRVYPVVERDGQRFADVGGAPAKRSWAEMLRGHAREQG